jgi:hypothetical protein
VFKKLVLFICLAIASTYGVGQGLHADELMRLLHLNRQKQQNVLQRLHYNWWHQTGRPDSTVEHFKYQSGKKNTDSIKREITAFNSSYASAIQYKTTLQAERDELLQELKQKGFYCNSQQPEAEYYQHQYFNARPGLEKENDTTEYFTLLINRKIFPPADSLYYADDLIHFDSHEYLSYYFGEQHVKKDIYYMEGNELANCSVLFINTARQVVFLWKDEVNRRGIASLLLGGQQNLHSAQEKGSFVAESNWQLKSGLKPGMSLFELRKLNKTDFSFYGGKSLATGNVIAAPGNYIDFSRQQVTLGCVNCKDDKFARAAIVTADEALSEERILFILSIALYP